MKAMRLFLAGSVFALGAAVAAADGPVLSGIVLTNDRTVDATSHQTIAKGVWREGMNDQQKAYAMWRFFTQRGAHREQAPVIEDESNAAELLTKTGYCICGNWAGYFAQCLADNGMTAARVGLAGHWVNAVNYWGDWHTFDTDMDNICIDADGLPANPYKIRSAKDADGKWVFRMGPPIKSFPWYLGPDNLNVHFSVYAAINLSAPIPPIAQHKWAYNLRLRPGQELSGAWCADPDVGFVCVSHLPNAQSKQQFKNLREYLEGTFDYYTQKEGKPKWSWGYRRGGLCNAATFSAPGIDGNGRLTMDLGADGFKNALAMASAADNLEVKDGKLALKNPAKPGTLSLDFALPYPYGDAWLEKPLPAKGLKVEVGVGGQNFHQVYPGGEGVDDGQRIRLFDLVRGRCGFAMRLTLEPGAAPMEQFKAIGAFHFCYTVMPFALKGRNQIAVRLADPSLLADNPLHVTYVYDQVTDDKRIVRIEKAMTFKPDATSALLDAGDKHWPLMREIRMKAGGEAPQAAAPAEETAELDWSAAPWDWAYNGVNFWNDFERGDRGRWIGRLTTKNTCRGSDFALDSSILNADGQRDNKINYYACFLNRDTKFRCNVWVKNVSRLTVGTNNQDEPKSTATTKSTKYYQKEFRGLKDGAWQTFEFAFNDLSNGTRNVQNNWFLAYIYLHALPAEGKEAKDVEFTIDDAVCWDGQLKYDPIADPDAPQKALAEDPIWSAKPPPPKPATAPAAAAAPATKP